MFFGFTGLLYRCYGGIDLNRISISDNDKWKMRIISSDSKGKWIKAVVPGSVYTDLLREGLMEDPFFKDNEDKALMLMDNDFEYETSFNVSKDFLSCYDQILHFDGLDTVTDVFLNGQKLGSTENMHRMYEFDIKDIVKEKGNKLTVLFHSPTRYIKEAVEKDYVDGSSDAMPGFPHIRKTHSSFGWDWGAHLPDAGIYRPVYLIGSGSVRLESVQILQKHITVKNSVSDKKAVKSSGRNTKTSNKNNINESTNVKISFKPELLINSTDLSDLESALSKLTYDVKITDPDGREVRSKETKLFPSSGRNKSSDKKPAIDAFALKMSGIESADGLVGVRVRALENSLSITIEDAKIWWPRGYGQQPLYDVEVTLYEDGHKIDSWTKRIGLRTVDLNLKKGRKAADFAIRVNGTPIFAMGADYIPEDHLLGRVNPATTRSLLEKAAFANHNCVRVWGGGYYPEDWFYDICDELGLLVWQDMMFACAVYHLTEKFENNIKEEFRQNLRRLRHHASLGLICGNNEMEMFVDRGVWVHSKEEVRDYTIMYERIIPGMLTDIAPQVSYWPSSPSSGGAFDDPGSETRGDQHYWDVWHGDKPFTEYRKFRFRFLSEFGFQSFPLRKTIDLITDDENDRNIFSYVMERHQRNGAANGKIMNYMQQTYRYPSDFDTLLYASHMLQADGIRLGIEHFRRYRGECMGAVVWQLNDCWPVASWSSIDYAGRLKALHYAEKRAFAPLMISCEENGRINCGKAVNEYPKDFEKSIRLNVANESMEDRVVTAIWELRNANGTAVSKSEVSCPVSGTKKITVPALTSVWLDKVDMEGVDEFSQYVSYHLLDENGIEISGGSVIFSLPKYFKYEDPKLELEASADTITITSSAYARGVEILNDNEDIILSDNYFDMDKGTKTIKVISGSCDNLRLRSVYDIK